MFIGIFGALSVDSFEAPKGGFVRNTAAWVIFIGVSYLGNRLGNRLGDWLDGTEFTALETAAILNVVGNQMIMDQESSGKQAVENMTLNQFRDQLSKAINALYNRSQRGVDTNWIPFY